MARIIPTAVFAKDARFPEGTDRLAPGFGQQPSAAPFAVTPFGIAPGSIPQPDEVGAVTPEYLYDLGLTTAAMAFHSAAIEALRECTALAPDHAPAWRKLAEVLRLAKEDKEAAAADAAAIRADVAAEKWRGGIDPRTAQELEKAENELRASFGGKGIEGAATALRTHLMADPLDAAAMRSLARIEARLGDAITSLRLLERALDVAPDYWGARESYAEALLQEWRHAGIAVAQTARLIAHDPRNSHYRYLHAYAAMQTGDLETTIGLLAGLLQEQPDHPGIWLSYAQALQFLGRRGESVKAFRRCLELQPDMGQAYLGLAELRGKDITGADVAAMQAQLKGTAMQPESRQCMYHALARTFERAGDFAASFAAYEQGSRIVREQAERHGRGAEATGDLSDPVRIERLKTVFSRENLRTKLIQAPASAVPDTPIFVVGLPRAGSTLVEQILASHSRVEGTRELPLMDDIVHDLTMSRIMVMPDAYPECLLDMTREQLAALGARYIEESRAYRQTGRPWFVDKRTWNWMEVGLIHLMLPQAKVIDIRREPMAACVAMYKQLLPFAYDLEDLGRHYKKYVGMMDHWESVLPGRVHFVQYERLVTDTESEIHRLLAYCGLPFEEGCLRFWETDRSVSTPSSEQVRRPIYRDAIDGWRNFEPWLAPLKKSLAEAART